MEGIASSSALAWRDPAPILRPRSIGIVGASPTARWVQIFLEQIPQAGFRGPLWPINPSYERIGDVPCYRSVRDTPELRQCQAGIRALASNPRRGAKRGDGERDVPVEIAGVRVEPGQWCYADADGILISDRALG